MHITVCAGEEVDKVARGANGMDEDRLGKVGNKLVKDRLLLCKG